jgi:1-acyl-sn-glycerol-3-phosphate acyltransferase
MRFEKPALGVKSLEGESGEKDWTYDKLQKALRFFIGKVWGEKFKVEGGENIPKKEAAIIAVNHSSHLDPEFLMAAIDRPIHFVGLQDEEFSPFYVKIFYKLAGVISVSRNLFKEGGRDFVKNIQEVVKNGELIAIFPEGMLEDKKNKGDVVGFKSGVFSIAKKYGLNVIPVYLSGTDKVRPDSKARILQKINIEPVEVKIGQALNPDGLSGAEDIRKAIIDLARKKDEGVVESEE